MAVSAVADLMNVSRQAIYKRLKAERAAAAVQSNAEPLQLTG